jgi:hypothetical protein
MGLNVLITSFHPFHRHPLEALQVPLSSSGASATTHSVVSNIEAIDAAFSSARLHHFCRIDDTCGYHVFEFVFTGIVTEIPLPSLTF